MNSGFRIWLGIFFLVVIILLSIAKPAEADNLKLIRSKRAQSRTCDCRYAQDSPVCASNGVTYPSMCRFDCAKQRVKRLRVVSSGTCRGRSGTDYWSGGRRTTKPPMRAPQWSWSW